MRNIVKFALLTLVIAVPMFADEPAEDRHQSFLSYDDGGTVIRSGEEGEEVEAHRNLPVYPGDEIVTARRGRAEVRLSDGNIIGIDRTTALRLISILDSYEGADDETVAQLRYGKVAVHRTDLGRDHVRLDTDNASYVAAFESIYSVETDGQGRDRVMVFDGSVEVRTRSRVTRVREGDAVTVDSDGAYDLVGDQRNAADDFERWFLKRAERLDKRDNRYVDRRMGYWADELDEHGTWVNVAGIGWSWRPVVSVGWRPYYNGYWHHSRFGSLTWVSYDPWGWGTYHYGRWAHDPLYGWIWAPGYGYSPAWVYWMYGPGYVGWAPSGYWDCYRPYYDWNYSQNRYASHYGFGFYGRVRVSELDLRPWTFVNNGTLISHRVDRAALTTDAIKHRFGQLRDGFTTVGGGAPRFTREEFRDPAEAVKRRALSGRHTGRETGAPPNEIDLTSFIRRDANISGDVRDRVARVRGGAPSGGGSAATPARSTTPTVGGGLAPIGRGSVAPIGRGSVAPIPGGVAREPAAQPAAPSTTPTTGRRNGGSGGRVDRGSRSSEPRVIGGGPSNGSGSTVTPVPERRERVGRPAEPREGGSVERPSRSATQDGWRKRVRSEDTPAADSGSRGTSTGGKSDVPRRVIDRIGGARIRPREDNASGSTAGGGRSGTRVRAAAPSGGDSSRSAGSSTRSSGSSNSSGSASSGRSSGSSSSGSATSGSSSRSGGESTRSAPSRDSSGGKIKRD
jgi:hypothetical protein